MVKKVELTLFPAVGDDQTRHEKCVVDSPGTCIHTFLFKNNSVLSSLSLMLKCEGLIANYSASFSKDTRCTCNL